MGVVSRSTGLFVLVYALFYYLKRSHMYGTLQTVEFFGYTLLGCYAFFLMLGTVSFLASLPPPPQPFHSYVITMSLDLSHTISISVSGFGYDVIMAIISK